MNGSGEGQSKPHDVLDEAGLAKFRSFATRWRELFLCDRNSLTNQLINLLWDSLTFLTFNEARRLAEKSYRKSPILSSIFVEQQDRAFVYLQSIGIRRLADSRGPDVASIPTLIDEISENLALLTREIYVSGDGLLYEYEPVQSAFFDSQPPGQIRGSIPSSGMRAWHASERRHRLFDILSATEPGTRKRDDSIIEQMPEILQNAFQRSKAIEISQWANKFIAHAADAQSRDRLKSRIAGNQIDVIIRCNATLHGIANFIGTYLLQMPTIAIPVAQYDMFANWSDNILPSAQVTELRCFWREKQAFMEQQADDEMARILNGIRSHVTGG